MSERLLLTQSSMLVAVGAAATGGMIPSGLTAWRTSRVNSSIAPRALFWVRAWRSRLDEASTPEMNEAYTAVATTPTRTMAMRSSTRVKPLWRAAGDRRRRRVIRA